MTNDKMKLYMIIVDETARFLCNVLCLEHKQNKLFMQQVTHIRVEGIFTFCTFNFEITKKYSNNARRSLRFAQPLVSPRFYAKRCVHTQTRFLILPIEFKK